MELTTVELLAAIAVQRQKENDGAGGGCCFSSISIPPCGFPIITEVDVCSSYPWDLQGDANLIGWSAGCF
ncbi:hypothetical protein L2E82_16779 [Cichorium intybus]|uniref:Uncharacterized protein n=1 Tax=Cichorium intybus TaxID=13427 RepID=A0ACB9F646_CICIN|nr:hypothetical protein L2E82_16779 [Cichorium intybus]